MVYWIFFTVSVDPEKLKETLLLLNFICLPLYIEEALEKSNGVKQTDPKQTKMANFFTIVEQNAEKPGPSGQKFSKPPLKELNEALELLSDED